MEGWENALFSRSPLTNSPKLGVVQAMFVRLRRTLDRPQADIAISIETLGSETHICFRLVPQKIHKACESKRCFEHGSLRSIQHYTKPHEETVVGRMEEF